MSINAGWPCPRDPALDVPSWALLGLSRCSKAPLSCPAQTWQGKTIATPALKGTILPGVTRRSVIELAQDAGFEVEERDVSISEAMDADEVLPAARAAKIILHSQPI